MRDSGRAMPAPSERTVTAPRADSKEPNAVARFFRAQAWLAPNLAASDKHKHGERKIESTIEPAKREGMRAVPSLREGARIPRRRWREGPHESGGAASGGALGGALGEGPICTNNSPLRYSMMSLRGPKMESGSTSASASRRTSS